MGCCLGRPISCASIKPRAMFSEHCNAVPTSWCGSHPLACRRGTCNVPPNTAWHKRRNAPCCLETLPCFVEGPRSNRLLPTLTPKRRSEYGVPFVSSHVQLNLPTEHGPHRPSHARANKMTCGDMPHHIYKAFLYVREEPEGEGRTQARGQRSETRGAASTRRAKYATSRGHEGKYFISTHLPSPHTSKTCLLHRHVLRLERSDLAIRKVDVATKPRHATCRRMSMREAFVHVAELPHASLHTSASTTARFEVYHTKQRRPLVYMSQAAARCKTKRLADFGAQRTP